MIRRAAVALACAALLACAGCADADPPPPAAQVALGLGQELAALDAQLDGVAAALPADEPDLREHAARLWGRSVRAEAELRKRLDLAAPGGDALRRAAEATIHAAEQIHAAAAAGAPAPPEGLAELEAARAALDEAAAALDAELPPPADGPLEALAP